MKRVFDFLIIMCVRYVCAALIAEINLFYFKGIVIFQYSTPNTGSGNAEIMLVKPGCPLILQPAK